MTSDGAVDELRGSTLSDGVDKPGLCVDVKEPQIVAFVGASDDKDVFSTHHIHFKGILLFGLSSRTGGSSV